MKKKSWSLLGAPFLCDLYLSTYSYCDGDGFYDDCVCPYNEIVDGDLHGYRGKNSNAYCGGGMSVPQICLLHEHVGVLYGHRHRYRRSCDDAYHVYDALSCRRLNVANHAVYAWVEVGNHPRYRSACAFGEGCLLYSTFRNYP